MGGGLLAQQRSMNDVRAIIILLAVDVDVAVANIVSRLCLV